VGLPDGPGLGPGRQAGVVCGCGWWVHQAVVAVARRRPASLRSRNTAAAAAARAAPAAIRATCQAAMPPVLITWTVAGAGAMGRMPPSPYGTGLANAAVAAAAAEASRPEMTAARTAASRPRRAPACPVALQRRDR
jgi:hypothetical protein